MNTIDSRTANYTIQPNRSNNILVRSGVVLLTGAALLTGCVSVESSQPNGTSYSASPQATLKPQQPPTVTPNTKVLLPGSSHTEVQQFGANTFINYKTVSGYGPQLPKGTTVAVDCLATGPTETAPSVKGRWYHLIGPAQYAGYFAAANTFENGSTEGPLESQPPVDPNVPACPN
jgi:hypothetical protein